MDPINIPPMLAYIPAPWIRHGIVTYSCEYRSIQPPKPCIFPQRSSVASSFGAFVRDSMAVLSRRIPWNMEKQHMDKIMERASFTSSWTRVYGDENLILKQHETTFHTKFVLILPPRKVRVPPDKKLGLVIRNNQPACRVGWWDWAWDIPWRRQHFSTIKKQLIKTI